MIGPRFNRLAVVGVIMAAALLTACGRRGPLDLPPSAAAPQETPQAGDQPQGTALQPRSDDTRPTAAPGQKRALPMDVILN